MPGCPGISVQTSCCASLSGVAVMILVAAGESSPRLVIPLMAVA